MNQLFHHKELGTITVCKSSRARQYRLSLKPDGTLTLTIPREGSMDRALKFAEQKKEWIDKARIKTELFAGETSRFSVPSSLQFGHIHISVAGHPGISFRLKKLAGSSSYIILCPEGPEGETEEFQDKLRKITTEIFRKEARVTLPERLALLSRHHNLPFLEAKVKKMSTRWGSCSARNNIHLNIHLVRLPQELCDYVLLHELTHTRHKHHGPSFHEHLNKLTGGRSKELSKALKQYHPDRF